MNKKKYATSGERNFLFLFVCLVFLGSIAFFIANANKIDKMQEEIGSMPHYECWDEVNNSRARSCINNCIELAYYNIPIDCSTLIVGECENIESRVDIAYKNYMTCAKAEQCISRYEVKEICEIIKLDELKR